MKTDFIDFLNQDENSFNEMNDYPIPNGILLYGSSKEKQEFVNWIKNAVPKDKTVVKEFKFDSDNIEKSGFDILSNERANSFLKSGIMFLGKTS